MQNNLYNIFIGIINKNNADISICKIEIFHFLLKSEAQRSNHDMESMYGFLIVNSSKWGKVLGYP